MNLNLIHIFIIFPLIIISLNIKLSANSTDVNTQVIADELLCPVCRGQTVAESNSDLAKDMREIIRKKLENGENREEILNFFIKRYGETVLASPPAKGINLIIWLLPVIILFLGFIYYLYYLVSRDNRKNLYNEEKKVHTKNKFLDKVDEELKNL